MQFYLAIGGFLVVVLFTGVIGLAIVARRLGSLISLHHHLAGGTNNKDAPKKGASGKPRRLTSPARRNRQRD
jgi:hypothetical protein